VGTLEEAQRGIKEEAILKKMGISMDPISANNTREGALGQKAVRTTTMIMNIDGRMNEWSGIDK
jgi:hypothetical protein